MCNTDHFETNTAYTGWDTNLKGGYEDCIENNVNNLCGTIVVSKKKVTGPMCKDFIHNLA